MEEVAARGDLGGTVALPFTHRYLPPWSRQGMPVLLRSAHVVGDIKQWVRLASLRCPMHQKVHQRIDARFRHVRILAKVVRRIEQRVGLAPLPRTVLQEMHQRIHTGSSYVRVL